MQLASRSETTLEVLQKEVQAWERAYDSAPRTSGPSKWRLHADFMHSTYNNIVAAVVQRQEQAARVERAQAVERQRNFDQQLAQATLLLSYLGIRARKGALQCHYHLE